MKQVKNQENSEKAGEATEDENTDYEWEYFYEDAEPKPKYIEIPPLLKLYLARNRRNFQDMLCHRYTRQKGME